MAKQWTIQEWKNKTKNQDLKQSSQTSSWILKSNKYWKRKNKASKISKTNKKKCHETYSSQKKMASNKKLPQKSEASKENNQEHVECTPPRQTKTKQNGTMETVLTKLYSKEMVTKNKPKCEKWILRVAQCAVFSTAVLAAWFKFSQTNEVWPLVHNRENYFTR